MRADHLQSGDPHVDSPGALIVFGRSIGKKLLSEYTTHGRVCREHNLSELQTRANIDKCAEVWGWWGNKFLMRTHSNTDYE